MAIPGFAFLTLLVVAVIAALVVAGGAILIYRNEIAKDHPHCWWEIAEQRGEEGGVCRYVTVDSNHVVRIPLADVRIMLSDEAASCPPRLRVHLCAFPEGRIVVRAVAMP